MLHALANFAQSSYTVTYTTSTTTTSSSLGSAFWTVYCIALVAFVVLMITSMWRVFTKAGRPGWAAIVPIYNTIVLLKIVRRPLWWIFLFLIPFVNIVIGIFVYSDLAKAFGKGVGYTLLLLFVPIVGFPMLGFGSATYQPKALAR